MVIHSIQFQHRQKHQHVTTDHLDLYFLDTEIYKELTPIVIITSKSC